jgi:hypothetical protein
MSKFLKRIGTQSHRFIFEVHIDKVEITLPPLCRVSIALKRGNLQKDFFLIILGEHKIETTKTPTVVENVAVFNEKLALNVTMYFEKKKKKYLSKEVRIMKIFLEACRQC